MKAIVQDQYGPPEVLRLEDIDQPVPGKGQVLVRVHAAALNPADTFVMTGTPYIMRLGFGLRRPRGRVRGMDLAGTVAAVGPGVTRLRVGDQVFGEGEGALAEFALAQEDRLTAKPASATFAQAAAVPMAGLAALHAIRDHSAVQPGQKVLIIGAAGGIGTYAVQIAASLGAIVTGVCSTRNVDLVHSLGAKHVVDYRHQDPRQTGERYHVILDNVASHSMSDLRRMLTRDGLLLPNNGTTGGRWFGPIGRLAGAWITTMFVRQRLRTFVSMANRDDLATLSDLLAAGTIAPVIGHTFPLAQAADAIQQVATGHVRGKVVVTIQD